MLVVAIAISLVPALQEPEPPSLPEGWGLLNRVDLIVNEECITRAEVVRAVQRSRGEWSSLEEYGKLLQERAVEQIFFLLQVQAGRDLGFDEERVKALTRDQFERVLERAGSVSNLAEELERADRDSATFRQETRSRIYSELWLRSVDGRSPGPGGRPYVDRFLRPGRMAFEHRRRRERASPPAEVVLQQLWIDSERHGLTLEQAEQRAGELRQRILAGEDFGEVVEEARAGVPGTGGVLPPIDEARLRLMPEIHEFVAGAEPGDVSEVLPYRQSEVLTGFTVLKLLERRVPPPPSLGDREFQKGLARDLQAELDQERRDLALRRLLQAAYVWPPEAFRARGRP